MRIRNIFVKLFLFTALFSSTQAFSACDIDQAPNVKKGSYTAKLVEGPSLENNGQTRASFEVKGMVCVRCEGKIRTKISSIEGVSSVEASKEKERVTVFYDGQKITHQKIKQEIESLL